MKNKKTFGVINILNLTLWLCFIMNFIWHNYFENNFYYQINYDTLLFPGIFTVIVFSFYFFCFKLNRSFKEALPLSNATRIAGAIVAVLFSIITLIFLWLFFEQLLDYFNTKFSRFEIRIPIHFILPAFCFTSTYLCIAYWIIRKRVKTQLSNIISAIGEKENS